MDVVLCTQNYGCLKLQKRTKKKEHFVCQKSVNNFLAELLLKSLKKKKNNEGEEIVVIFSVATNVQQV